VSARRNPARRGSILCGATVALLFAGVGGEHLLARRAVADGPPAGQCVPATLNRSAVLPGTGVSVSPLPDSLDASPQTQISLLGVPAGQLSDVRVKGSRTGVHAGRLRAYSQGDGASFVPSKPFQTGEIVTVSGRVSTPVHAEAFAYHFTVAWQDPIKRARVAQEAQGKTSEYQRFYSRPDLEPPTVAVTVSSPLASAGDIFATPYSGPGQDGPMIFDETGQLVWFDPLPNGTEATNLQVQQLGGQPVLTWWQGYIPPQGFGEGEEVIANSAYQQTVVKAGNGYLADLHDFKLTAAGTALLTVFDPIHCDLSKHGGSHGAAVTDGLYQEVDLKTGLVRREWHSLDHVGLSETYSSASKATTEWPLDFFHINSLDPHPDGTLLISARNTSALYSIDEQTGQILTRIGGKRSSLKLGAGTATAYQHDATLLPNGTISVFDNGGVPKVHPQSRGIVLAINAQTGTETLLAQYEHPTALASGSQGNFQTLANGDPFIGWGAEPYFSEFSASGQLLFDAHLPGKDQSYRGYRFQWTGTPPSPPSIAATSLSASGPATVYMSWNGATNVASWRVLAGPSPSALTAVVLTPRSGFETAAATPGPAPYVAAQALDSTGAVIGTSKTIKG
jgi:Arylsulfotransferase (ASST)